MQWLQCCKDREEDAFQNGLVQHANNARIKDLYEGLRRCNYTITRCESLSHCMQHHDAVPTIGMLVRQHTRKYQLSNIFIRFLRGTNLSSAPFHSRIMLCHFELVGAADNLSVHHIRVAKSHLLQGCDISILIVGSCSSQTLPEWFRISVLTSWFRTHLTCTFIYKKGLF